MMNKLLYIFSCLILLCACTRELPEFNHDNEHSGKVAIDFSVQVNDPSIATKAMADDPHLNNLMLAVFDETGYLIEYTWAVDEGTEYARENATRYKYKAYLTQSKAPRIIHFIGNAPSEIKFGNEESVLASISGSLGSTNEDMYWYRKEIPMISGTSSGGAMALAEGDDSGLILQATPQTLAYMNDIPLIRNFAKINLTAASDSGFILDSYFVVGTPKIGLAAAYNYSSGEFVDYFDYVESTDPELSKEGIKVLGNPKSYQYLTETEKYDANVPAASQSLTLAEAQTKSVASGSSYFVYEKETPLSAEDAPYIIVYGTYSGKKYYYKVDLRDKDKYFPLLRNFQYNVTITKVSREGYETIEEAAKSSGSGDISSSMTTISLAYISDGTASLEVSYTEKYLTAEKPDTLRFTFLTDVNDPDSFGAVKDIWIQVNDPGSNGAAIASVNGIAYTKDLKITPASNPGEIIIIPTTPTNSEKMQTLTIYARYTRDKIEHILQRTVKYIVQTKRTMVVKLDPYEVPTVSGSEFDVLLTIPAGLSKSIFPLKFAIEAEALSINPQSDEHMPVTTGESITGNGKSTFYFVKTLTKETYIADKENTIVCHFKTTKAASATKIYAVNDNFITQYIGADLEVEDENVYLSNYTEQTFTNLRINNYQTPDPIVSAEDVKVKFTFDMDERPSGDTVTVTLGGLKPANENDPNFKQIGIDPVTKYAIYRYKVNSTSGSLDLMTYDEDSPIYVGLDAHHFVHNEMKVGRKLYDFTGSKNPSSLGTNKGERVTYTLTIPQSGYYDNMVVTVEFDGLDFASGMPADGKWTDKRNGVYEYRPSSAGNTPLDLVSTISEERINYITFSAPGFNTFKPDIPQNESEIIPEGRLIVNAARNNAFATNGTIYLYTTSNYSDTPVGYRFRRSTYTEGTGWNADEYSNGTATNTGDITLSGVNAQSTIYIQYVNGRRTWRGSFKLSDALDNNGANITLTRYYN